MAVALDGPERQQRFVSGAVHPGPSFYHYFISSSPLSRTKQRLSVHEMWIRATFLIKRTTRNTGNAHSCSPSSYLDYFIERLKNLLNPLD